MEFKVQRGVTSMNREHQDWQMNKASSMLQTLSLWKDNSMEAFATIINTNCNFVNREINEMVEEICGLQAQLAAVKDERNGLLKKVDNLNDENRQLKAKLQPQIKEDLIRHPGSVGKSKMVDKLDLIKRGYRNKKGKLDMTGDQVGEANPGCYCTMAGQTICGSFLGTKSRCSPHPVNV